MVSVKQQSSIALGVLVVALVISTLMYWSRPSAELAAPQYSPVSVDAALVTRQNLRIPVEAQGTVAPLRATSIQAEVSGRIVETAETFLVGGFVAAGDVILRIDPRDYKTRLLRAEAALKSAASNLVQEQGRAEVALREWKKLPPGSQRSQAASDLYLRKPQLEQAEAQLLAAEADLNTARDNLERSIIRAPYDALIRDKHSELGQFVGPGTPLAQIFSIEQAEVRLPIPQSTINYLDLPRGVEQYHNGPNVELYTDIGGKTSRWTAQAHRTEGVFDERSRVMYLVVRIEDPYGLAHTGMDAKVEPMRMGSFVNARIQGREIENLVALPRYILRAGNLLWVIDKDNILRNRQVEMLRTGGDQIYVTAGLDEGDLVCLTLMDPSFTGATVAVRTTTATDQLMQLSRAEAVAE